MNCTIKIMTQYFENYSETKTPYWKPKGGQEFDIIIDSDIAMYSKYLDEHLNQIISEQSNEHCKYEYIDHDVQFIEPITLDSNKLNSLITNEDLDVA